MTLIIAAVAFFVIFMGICLREHFRVKSSAERRGDPVKSRDENPNVIGGTSLDRFFVECVLAEITDFTLEKNVERAKLLADKYGLSYKKGGVEALFRSGMEAHKPISRRIRAKHLDQLHTREKQEYEALTRYAELYGKEKQVAMLGDRMKELRQRAQLLEQGAKVMIMRTQQHERDWAAWGGAVSGAAGFTAGVATALNIQTENARIREQNQRNLREAMPLYMRVSDDAYENRLHADNIERQLRKINEKLVSKMTDEEVMKLLTIASPSVEVSETGAFRVTATIKTNKPLFMYGDVSAAADGTILAHVHDDTGKEIGTAKLVLPVEGVYKKTGVMGIGLTGAEPGKRYCVTFTPYKLWLIER